MEIEEGIRIRFLGVLETDATARAVHDSALRYGLDEISKLKWMVAELSSAKANIERRLVSAIERSAPTAFIDGEDGEVR